VPSCPPSVLPITEHVTDKALRVLVVDDDPAVASYFEDCLVLEGCDVATAGDASTALAKLGATPTTS